MEYKNKLILVEKPRKNVALITLNNPPLNLVTLDLSAVLRETLFNLEQDDEVRVYRPHRLRPACFLRRLRRQGIPSGVG